MKSKAFILSIFAYFLIAFSSYANMFDWNAKKVVDASTTACNCNQGLADLVEELIPAVVNISSEQIIKEIISWHRWNSSSAIIFLFEATKYDKFVLFCLPQCPFFMSSQCLSGIYIYHK